MNMRNDELREFSEMVLKALRTEADGRRSAATFCAEKAHDYDGRDRATWEGYCVTNKRLALAYEQAAALIEASLK